MQTAKALVHQRERERERERWIHTVRHHRTTVQATGQVQTHSWHIDVRVSTYGLRMLAHVIQSEKAQVGVEACASQKFRKSH